MTITDILTSSADTEYLRVTGYEFKKLTEGICYNADTIERLQQILAWLNAGSEDMDQLAWKQ